MLLAVDEVEDEEDETDVVLATATEGTADVADRAGDAVPPLCLRDCSSAGLGVLHRTPLANAGSREAVGSSVEAEEVGADTDDGADEAYEESEVMTKVSDGEGTLLVNGKVNSKDR